MPSLARVVWDASFTEYDFGATHPMSPVRLDLTARLCDALGVFDAEGVAVVGADVADDALLTTVHDADYVAAVRVASDRPGPRRPGLRPRHRGRPGLHRHAPGERARRPGHRRLLPSGLEGESQHAVNFTGGLHHAMPRSASGFCIYNDIAVGIQWLLDHGAERVAYVDVDVHHGDGVERIFWDDPRVLTISVHESGRALFPGTGWPRDIGGPDAEGDAVNVSLPPGLADAGWLRAIHAVVPPLVRAFKPDVLVTQHGCDTHAEDPLAHFAVTVDAQRAVAEAMHALSHEVCEGRWVALGGGGYEVVDVVPRTWTHLTAIAAHAPVKTSVAVPQGWRDHVEHVTGRPGPSRMGDLTAEDGPLWWRSWEMGYDPGSDVDRAVMATRSAVFPLHGLDVYFD